MPNPKQGVVTRDANAAHEIDFSAGRPPDKVREPRRRKVNVHVRKLDQLVNAIQQDAAKVGELYLIAAFTNRDGAATARRKMRRGHQREAWPELLPGFEFRIDTKILDEGSQLWAGVFTVVYDDDD
jgi:hypothetical protein